MKNTKDKTNALFVIRNNQTFDNHSDLVEISTEGNFKKRDGMYFLIYKEYTELGEISVFIKVKDQTVSITRSGACSSKMEYIENTKKEVLYHVPFGDMVMDLETESVNADLSSDGGKIKMKYKLTIGEECYYNDMQISVKLNEGDVGSNEI